MQALRIVIADNESIIRMDLREMLEEGGHCVVGEAADGLKAVALTRQHYPDLVIMDIKMPAMDGIAAAKAIAAEKIAPVLLLTAFSQKDIVEQAKNAGVSAYLVKPVKESNLFPAIEIARSRFQEFAQLEQELEHIKHSLATRKLLDRAKGILMDACHLSEHEAYRRIQQHSMRRRKSIGEIVQAIVDAAEQRKKSNRERPNL